MFQQLTYSDSLFIVKAIHWLIAIKEKRNMFL